MPWWGLEAIATADPAAVWAYGAEALTYARLRDEIALVRTVLRDHGIGAGSSVALRLPSGTTMLQWLFALWAEDAQVLLLDSRMEQAEVEAVCDLVLPTHRIESATGTDPLTGSAAEFEVQVVRIARGKTAADGIALLQCSSGTTGRPKVVARTGRSLLEDVDRHVRNPGMPVRGERVFLLASLTHAFGLAAGVLLCLRTGATLVLPDLMYPDELLERARRADVHAVFGVPVHFDLLSQASGQDRMPSLRLAVSCGDVLSASVRNRFTQRHGVPIGQAYGMTEVGAVAVDLAGQFQPPTVGTVLPGIGVRVSDGELYVRVERDPYPYADNNDRYHGGWLRTFDRAELDPSSGVLRLLGRTDSVRIIGGLKVDLTEVEAVLRSHPSVREAMVVFRADDSALGRPDMLEAFVSTTGTLSEDELLAWCQERLSAFKIPRLWHTGSALPRTGSGKLDRRKRS